MKKISIITINLNNCNGLEKTISSVAEQTCKDFEFIVVDGGSSDKSIDLIKSKPALISKWISEHDSGIFNAQNKGIEMAEGEYCLFLNSGDYLVDQNVLENSIPFINNEAICYGDMIIDKGNGIMEYSRSPLKVNSIQLLKDTLWHPVSFIRRDLFKKFGNYNEHFKIVSDYEFFVRVIISKKVFAKYIPVPVSVFNLTGVSSAKEYKMQIEKERKEVQDIYFNPLLLFMFRTYSKIMN